MKKSEPYRIDGLLRLAASLRQRDPRRAEARVRYLIDYWTAALLDARSELQRIEALSVQVHEAGYVLAERVARSMGDAHAAHNRAQRHLTIIREWQRSFEGEPF